MDEPESIFGERNIEMRFYSTDMKRNPCCIGHSHITYAIADVTV